MKLQLKNGIVVTMSRAFVLMNSVTYVVIMAFVLMLIRPSLLAAQEPPAPIYEAARKKAAPSGPPPAEELQLAGSLDQLAVKLAELAEELSTEPGAAPRRSSRKLWDDVTSLHERIVALDPKVDAGFDRVADVLGPASSQKHQRHQKAHQSFRDQMKRLKRHLDALRKADGAMAQAEAARAALAALDSQKPVRPHQALDPENLPFGRAASEARPPVQDLEGLRTLFPAATKAAASAADGGPGDTALLPLPEDTGETPAVQITPEIETLAGELGGDAIAIYNWVHDNVEFVPTYGAMQGSRMTLEARRGNAADIASLLVALLRASEVPARFAVGTIEVPASQLMNWLGDVPTPAVAQQLLGQGGIPNVGLLQGDEITHVRLEHVWVTAWLDFVPGRGVGSGSGDTWVPLDASFKQYAFAPSKGALEAVPFDGAGVTETLLQDAQVDVELGRISGVDPSYLFDALEEHQQSTQEFFLANGFDSTLEAIVGGKAILPSDATVLAASLPYRVLVRGEAQAALPAALRHGVTLKGYNSTFDRAAGNSSFSFDISLPELNSRRLALTYPPATPADAETLQDFINAQVATLPVYLIDVKPVITLDEEAVAVGSAVGMGSTQILDVILRDPAGSETITYNVVAGDESVIGINGNGIAEAVVTERFARVSADTAAENLHQVALHYWMETDFFDRLAAGGLGVFAVRRPSLGLFSSPLTVGLLFGVPRSGVYQSRIMDVKRSFVGVAGETPEQTRAFVQTAGFQGSFMEGSVFDQLFGRRLGRGISAMQLIFDATLGDIPVYEVTAENVASVLPLLSVSGAVKTDISNAVHSGKTVLVPETEILHDNYQGLGYIIQNPETGAGAYLISGGLNGGGLFECYPELVPIVVTVLAAILLAALLWWLWPFIAGALAGLLGGLGAGAPAYAAALIAFIAIFLSGSPAYASGGSQTGGQADPCNCPPPPPPPPCEVDLVPPSRPHYPCPGDHWHYRVYNQGPAPACINYLSGRLFGGCIPPPLPVPCPPI